MNLLTPVDWKDYELIDTGDREKLERFGKYILIRPEPQAVWKKAMLEEDWDKLHHARFSRAKSDSQQSAVGNRPSPPHHGTTTPLHHDTTSPSHKNPVSGIRPRSLGISAALRHPVTKEERGEWIRKPEMPDQWMISYDYKEMHLKFRLGLTAFGHIGVFPEQAENWKFIYDTIKRTSGQADKRTSGQADERTSGQADKRTSGQADERTSGFRILNLFAYTGGASLAAKAAGADVVHVDSVKQVIRWAREDMELSRLDGIRWVVEDALKFVRREVKRGNRYHGIILDPPAYGRGPEGEKWVLEEYIDELIDLCSELLGSHPTSLSSAEALAKAFVPRPTSFLVLSLYSMGFSSLIGENLVRSHFSDINELQSGELYFTDRAGRKLPLGTFTRIS